MAYDPIADGEAKTSWDNAKMLNPDLEIEDKGAVKYYPQPGPKFDGHTGNGGCVVLLILAVLGTVMLLKMAGLI